MLERNSSPSLSLPIEPLKKVIAPLDAAALNELAIDPPGVLEISLSLNFCKRKSFS